MLLRLQKTKGEIAIVGDYNIDLLKVQHKPILRTLLFSYLIFLRYDMFFVNQVALFFYLNCLRCVIIHSLECFLYLLRHNNNVVMVDITPGSEMQVYSYLHFFVNLVNMYHILFSW